MQRDRISTEAQKASRQRQIEENRSLTVNSNSKTNKQEYQSSPSTLLDDLSTSIDTDILLTDSTYLLPPQPQQILLSPEDLQRVENVSLFYQKRIEFAARDGLPWDPSVHANTFLQVLNRQSVSAIRLLSFFKQIPEFNQLNSDDKVTLVKSNLITILGIYCALSYNTETGQIIESTSDVPVNMQFFPILHGYKMCMRSGKIFRSFLQLGKYDRKIIELILIILILTKGISVPNHYEKQILNDEMSVYRAQTCYIELLWKYIQVTHGYEKAVNLFSQLIGDVISWQMIHQEMRNDVFRTLSPDDINGLVPVLRSLMHIL
ncbi:hypothetical protein I4U23_015944 [Adineta vaga]|nr:hypothetical protein I4U23_015944 [Adineta vaga]